MISVQKNFLFIHIPKTGGNSIQSYLQHFSEDEITINKDQDGTERFGVRNNVYNTVKHTKLRGYKAVLPRDLYFSLYKFATIRNPWDRVASAFFSPGKKNETFHPKAFRVSIQRKALLRDVLSEWPAVLRRLTRYTGWPPLDYHVDYLIRFEHLDHDFAHVCNVLDIPYVPLPRRNASTREHYSTYYTDETIELVRARFAEEIAFGKYQFERV